MLLGLSRRSYDSGGSSPQHQNAVVDGNDGQGDNGTGSSDKLGRSDHHRRSASSSDATPRPRVALPRTRPFLGLPGFHHDHHRRLHNWRSFDTYADQSAEPLDIAAPPGRQNANTNVFSADPSLSSHPPPQQPPKLLGFFSSNTTNHSKSSSPSRAQHHTDLDTSKERLYSGYRFETTAHKDKDISNTNMASVASSSAVSKAQTSPSKPSSTRTYDAKLVTREMHRLGSLAGLSPALTPSLASSASASTLTLAPSVSPSPATLGPNTSHGHSHVISALTSTTVSDKDNPWGTLHVHVLPLFNEEPLRVPIEDLNALVRRHIQTVLAASPSRALMTLATDARELIGAGMVTMNAKLTGLSDELLMSRLVELWSFFWDHILPYVEGVLLPLQTDQLLTSLCRTSKQHRSSSPTRQGAKIAPTIPTSIAAFSPSIDVRSVALCAFRDRVVLPMHGRLHTLLSPPQSKETLARLSQYRQPRLQQMLLVLTSERRVRPPSPTLSLRVPEVQPSAGEAAIADLLRLLSQAQQHARANHAPRQPLARGLTVRAATPSFLSAGIPRDRRGRIGGHDVKRMILSAGGWPVSVPATRRRDTPADDVDADAEDEGGDEGGETPRLGMIDSCERREMWSLRAPLEHHHRASTGGWGLGAGNEEKQREEEEDDDETPGWDPQGYSVHASSASSCWHHADPPTGEDDLHRPPPVHVTTGVTTTSEFSERYKGVCCTRPFSLTPVPFLSPLNSQHVRKDTARVAAGLKAAIHNPNVSEEAKEHAKEKLKELAQEVGSTHETSRENPRVLGGYKATLSNPNTSEQAKHHAEEVLQAAGIDSRHPDHSEEEHQTRVLAGYKAALHSKYPRVSEEAKQHAKEFLGEHGIES
ncbi:hypothetical protein PAXRUDRAFT_16276 [Paxillus rubicundulus Ve08.2h10]|uniref:HbrB-domain-containing protein n=1 Tax=Paxillus rubicundulus Ve08.2h10 TaxID=930991 RepID=A0A0D0DF06_9AGAM|nr:hypothetical protein PAXRUDRAFT_16276 [Paxillus rubicundulus Ve08.2h10]